MATSTVDCARGNAKNTSGRWASGRNSGSGGTWNIETSAGTAAGVENVSFSVDCAGKWTSCAGDIDLLATLSDRLGCTRKSGGRGSGGNENEGGFAGGTVEMTLASGNAGDCKSANRNANYHLRHSVSDSSPGTKWVKYRQTSGCTWCLLKPSGRPSAPLYSRNEAGSQRHREMI